MSRQRNRLTNLPTAKLMKLSKRKLSILDKKKSPNKSKKTPSNPKKKRSSEKRYFPEIDLLKAVAALLVILIHVTSQYKDDSNSMFIFWDLIHFSVGIFVIVSGFLYQNHPARIENPKDFLWFMWKKFKRIVIPYYIFAFLFVILVGFFGEKSFSDIVTTEGITQTLYLWGGVGNNWIPRLFITIMLVVGLESWFSKWLKQARNIIFAVSIAGAIYLLTRDLSMLTKFNNLPGWLVIFYTGRYIYDNYNWKSLVTILSSCLVIFAFLYILLEKMGLTLFIFNNKYPPNLYFVAYNIAAAIILWLTVYLFKDLAQKSTKTWSLIKFISRNSYEIFFYHLLIMEFWDFKLTPIVDWLVITFLTLCFIWIYRWIGAEISNQYHGLIDK